MRLKKLNTFNYIINKIILSIILYMNILYFLLGCIPVRILLAYMPLILNKVTATKTTYFSFASNGAIQFDGGLYQFIQHPYVLKFDGTKSVEFYDLNNDSLMLNNLIENKTAPIQKVQEIEKYLQAVIQQYNHKLITNKTY